MFDDALFCPPCAPDQWETTLSRLGLQKKQYIAIHVHYWKVPRRQVNAALDRLALLFDEFHDSLGLPYLLIPMVESDHDAMVYLSRRMKAPIRLLDCRSDFRLAISAIQGAKICISMKHHPIVFAMAGAVPTLSIAFEDYYFHKNFGALALFGQEQFMLRFENLDDGRFKDAVYRVWNDSDAIIARINAALEDCSAINGEIIRLYLASLQPDAQSAGLEESNV